MTSSTSIPRTGWSRTELDLGPRVRWSVTIVSVVLAALLPLYAPAYINFDLSMVMVYAIGGLGLNVLCGNCGQVSLGQSAFVALGAYISAILIVHGWNYLVALPVAVLAGFVLGAVIGRPALRLAGLQLALVTLALAIVTPPVIKRFDRFTDGQEGINVVTAQAPGWTGLANDQWVYLLTLVGFVVAWVVARRMTSNATGRSLEAIRDNEIVARTLGIRAANVKTIAFATSGAYGAAAGAFFVYVVQFVGPEAFGLTMAVAFLSLIVIGGLGTIPGALIGAFFVQYVPSVTDQVNQSLSGVVYGLSIVAVMFLMPRGVVGLLRWVGWWSIHAARQSERVA